jgi:hypothetical protein
MASPEHEQVVKASLRMVRTQRSAIAFAFDASTGVLTPQARRRELVNLLQTLTPEAPLTRRPSDRTDLK